jgi:hypothetical protein
MIMKTRIFTILVVLFLSIFFSSCSHRLVGTWAVQNYETVEPGKEGVSAKNIGTMTFKRNGKGTKELEFSALGIWKTDKTPYTWSVDGNFLTISGEDSDFAKTWIIVESKSKYQKLKSTDGANQVQIIELAKSK